MDDNNKGDRKITKGRLWCKRVNARTFGSYFVIETDLPCTSVHSDVIQNYNKCRLIIDIYK